MTKVVSVHGDIGSNAEHVQLLDVLLGGKEGGGSDHCHSEHFAQDGMPKAFQAKDY
jgi:hypothetical protein